MKSNRITREKKIVELMIRLYCRKKEKNKELCPECRTLLAYSQGRLDYCVFGSEKPTCRLCPVHCYKPQMRRRMQEIMRYAGPRMILYHPVAALRHLAEEMCITHLKRKK